MCSSPFFGNFAPDFNDRIKILHPPFVMKISAQDVNKLRQATGAGMMDCKKALVEAEGDFDKAVELLRKKGQKVADKRSDKEASEGAVFAGVSADEKIGTMIEINCETDFVARNDEFQNLGTAILETAQANKPADAAALLKLEINGKAIEAMLQDMMGKIGEKIEVSKYAQLTGDKVVSYIHPGAKVGVLVSFDGTDGVDVATVGKDVSMQIASMKPVAVDKSGVDQALLDKEFEIGKEQALNEGKPENIVEKIAQGKVNKFLKDSTLLSQEFVKDPSKTIEQYLKDQNPALKVNAFERMHVGF